MGGLERAENKSGLGDAFDLSFLLLGLFLFFYKYRILWRASLLKCLHLTRDISGSTMLPCKVSAGHRVQQRH